MSNNKPWEVLARRTVYDSVWIGLQLVDIRLPDGQILKDVHLINYKRAAASAVPIGSDGRVLMIDHYRFQTDTRGWEIPAGRVEADETPEEAISRELLEETGHTADSLRYLGCFHPSNGSSNQIMYVYVARGVTHVGDIQDTNEVMGLRWFSGDEVRELIARNEIQDGLSLTSLCWAITQGEI